MKQKITEGSWMLLCDEVTGENVMVKVIAKDDNLRTATVEIDLAVRRTDSPKKYTIEVNYESLRQPCLRKKQKRTSE